MNDPKDYSYCFGLVTVGAPDVGKTCLIKRFAEDRFLTDSGPTPGVDFFCTNVNVEGLKLKLLLWDTAGQERYRAFTNTYFSNSIGIFLVFSLADRWTFGQVRYWLHYIDEEIKARAPVFLLVGNKSDLPRQVHRAEAELMAELHNLEYIETSAKTGENVEHLFTTMAQRICEGIEKGTIAVESRGIKKGARPARGSTQTETWKKCC